MLVANVFAVAPPVDGPETPAPSVTEFAVTRNWTVPTPQSVVVTVKVVPGCVPVTVMTQFCAVPTLVMSSAARPEIGSFDVSVNVCVVEFVGDEGFCVNDNVGAPGVASTYRDAAVTAVVGPALPAVSVTAFAASCRSSVPSPQLATVTLIAVPDDDAGVMTQFCAVPALEKSLDCSPVIASLKVMV
jgi:hypothetical protein